MSGVAELQLSCPLLSEQREEVSHSAGGCLGEEKKARQVALNFLVSHVKFEPNDKPMPLSDAQPAINS